ncbi:MAG TPA: hypothetical protein VG408_07980 [Actinomycetota bacterium]|nr:hypothetical protein [Actinomycetota bacterium]
MTLHDRLKPVPVEEQPGSRAWRAVVLGVVLAVFAAGFAVAMPYALRPVGGSDERSSGRGRPLSSPSAHPAAVSLPSPGASGRPEVAEASAVPSRHTAATDELGTPTNEVRRPVAPPVRRQPARREDEDDEAEDHGAEVDDDDDTKPSKASHGSKQGSESQGHAPDHGSGGHRSADEGSADQDGRGDRSGNSKSRG